MSRETHGRAYRLIAEERVEGLVDADREWLSQHLSECPECEQRARATENALASLRALSVPMPPALASRTQLRVYLRAGQIQERRGIGWMFWAACGVSWAAGIASAPYVWRAFDWLGHEAGLPALVWKTGFALWWTAPAVVAAVAALLDRSDLEWFRTR